MGIGEVGSSASANYYVAVADENAAQINGETVVNLLTSTESIPLVGGDPIKKADRGVRKAQRQLEKAEKRGDETQIERAQANLNEALFNQGNEYSAKSLVLENRAQRNAAILNGEPLTVDRATVVNGQVVQTFEANNPQAEELREERTQATEQIAESIHNLNGTVGNLEQTVKQQGEATQQKLAILDGDIRGVQRSISTVNKPKATANVQANQTFNANPTINVNVTGTPAKDMKDTPLVQARGSKNGSIEGSWFWGLAKGRFEFPTFSAPAKPTVQARN